MSSIIKAISALGSVDEVLSDVAAERTVIAVVIEWRGRIALFRRSRGGGHDSGLWHCITGFVEVGATPEQQALDELSEEAGLQAEDLLDLRQGPVLVLPDSCGSLWLVYTFTAVTTCRRLRLDWEHDSYRWTKADKVKRFMNRVMWLEDVLEATGHLPRSSQRRRRAAPSAGAEDR
jgi:8-oxo-dGTP pyrophosphatase MutT (NUDIX family)